MKLVKFGSIREAGDVRTGGEEGVYIVSEEKSALKTEARCKDNINPLKLSVYYT